MVSCGSNNNQTPNDSAPRAGNSLVFGGDKIVLPGNACYPFKDSEEYELLANCEEVEEGRIDPMYRQEAIDAHLCLMKDKTRDGFYALSGAYLVRDEDAEEFELMVDFSVPYEIEEELEFTHREEKFTNDWFYNLETSNLVIKRRTRVFKKRYIWASFNCKSL